jgi:prepilin-type N-terminal cleavage/methylation domain-containing protein
MRFLESSPRHSSRSGFTLIEIMIVICIIGIVLAAGIPSVFRAMHKDALRQAVSDIVEGCSNARALAILQGTPAEFVIRAEDGTLSVQKARLREGEEFHIGTEQGNPAPRRTATVPTFNARLADDIAVKLIYVNFKDQMEAPEARVRFYPNGTSDEFTIIFFSDLGERMISTDVITGQANSEVLR